MKLWIMVGKGMTALFWSVLIANLLQPFAQPFGLLLNLIGAAVLAIHIAEYLFFRERLKSRQQPLLQFLQVMLFGIFHLLSLSEEASLAASEASGGLQMEAENA